MSSNCSTVGLPLSGSLNGLSCDGCVAGNPTQDELVKVKTSTQYFCVTGYIALGCNELRFSNSAIKLQAIADYIQASLGGDSTIGTKILNEFAVNPVLNSSISLTINQQNASNKALNARNLVLNKNALRGISALRDLVQVHSAAIVAHRAVLTSTDDGSDAHRQAENGLAHSLRAQAETQGAIDDLQRSINSRQNLPIVDATVTSARWRNETTVKVALSQGCLILELTPVEAPAEVCEVDSSIPPHEVLDNKGDEDFHDSNGCDTCGQKSCVDCA